MDIVDFTTERCDEHQETTRLADTELQLRRMIISRHRRCGAGGGVCDEAGLEWEVHDGRCAELRTLACLDREHPDFNPAWGRDD